MDKTETGIRVLRLLRYRDPQLGDDFALHFGVQDPEDAPFVPPEVLAEPVGRFSRPVEDRDAAAAERARDRCTLEKSSDPAKFKMYYQEELQKT